MIVFYSLGTAFLLAASMFATACVVTQCLVVIASYYRYLSNKVQVLEALLEITILFQTILISMMMTQVQNNAKSGFLVLISFTFSRWLAFTLICFFVLTMCILKKSPSHILPLLASIATLPVLQQFTGVWFSALFLASLCFWFLRSIFVGLVYRKELKTGISSLSIKQSLDALHTGIMFCDKNGTILLINQSMQQLMIIFMGKVERNANTFFNRLTQEDVSDGCEKNELEGQMVYRLLDETAWLFLDREIFIDNTPYRQISAVEVTLQWNTAAELSRQNALLKKRSKELEATLENIQAIYKKEAALRTKGRIHDVLGQRIALLVRSLREHGELDMSLLSDFKDGLPSELKEPTGRINTYQELETLIEVFHGIGVSIVFQGKWPQLRRAGRLFLNVITEGATNAVRHGFSTEIIVICKEDAKNWTMSISNNGTISGETITEGGGITNMRRRLSRAGGTLTVLTRPQFTLYIALPKGGFYDENIDR